MKIGERGQVTIPKSLRERFGLHAETEVEFRVVRDQIVLQKKARKLDLEKWKGKCHRSFDDLGYASVDGYMEDVRGR
jgi:AbrB family looped-hinge helix DNA binding protein